MTLETNTTNDPLSASPRIFENDLLDKLSRVHHLTPVVIYTPIILGFIVYSLTLHGAGVVAFLLLFGYVAWTLTEYFGHRYLFHTVFPLPFGIGPRFQFLIHGVHHIYPSDPMRLVMPVLLSGPIILIAYGVSGLLFGPTLRWPALAGFMIGYVVYDSVHYWTHHGQPRTETGRLVRRLHMLHHFRDATKGFGVHAVWWDYVFGTNYRKDDTLGTTAV
jgi:sterol desaturase/sphingolipid hydroxylase (fatty acid hydroxylase superfamily)